MMNYTKRMQSTKNIAQSLPPVFNKIIFAGTQYQSLFLGIEVTQ